MRLFCIALAAVLLSTCSAFAGDTVVPALITITNFRDAADIEFVSDATFVQGDTLRFSTNCRVYSTSDNSVTQGLDEVTVTVSMGDGSVADNIYTGIVVAATEGRWTCDVTVPRKLSLCYLQVSLADTNGNTYSYQPQKINTVEKMD